jgi:SNF2 family DNA or RNA helicase
VAPLALIRQWKREIETRTKNGLFRVHIHHGNTQLKKLGDFLQYDVVITTYSTLMAGYRKLISEYSDSSEQQSPKEEKHDGRRKSLLGSLA